MMRSVIYTLLLASFLSLAAACGISETSTPSPTPTQTPRTPSALEKVMALTPGAFAEGVLQFSDFAGARAFQGYQGDLSYEALSEFYFQGIKAGSDPYEGLAMPFSPGADGEPVGLPEFPFLAFDLGIWNSSAVVGWGVTPRGYPTFLNLQGRYHEDEIDSKLMGYEIRGGEYEKLDYQGVTYYALFEDYEQSLKYPLRMGALNRIALVEDWLLAAPSTDLIASLINIHHGSGDSLMGSVPHRRLADAIGDGMLSGAFKSRAVIKDPGIPGNYASLSLPIFQKYIDGPDKWQTLSDYDLTLAGYRITDGVEEIAIALYYSDPTLGERDRGELEHRWNTYGVNLPNVYEDYPATKACAPFTTEVIKGEEYSILVARCPYKRSEETRILLNTTSLWNGVPHRVLYPDLEDWRVLE